VNFVPQANRVPGCLPRRDQPGTSDGVISIPCATILTSSLHALTLLSLLQLPSSSTWTISGEADKVWIPRLVSRRHAVVLEAWQFAMQFTDIYINYGNDPV
jgi:hypothetical protein